MAITFHENGGIFDSTDPDFIAVDPTEPHLIIQTQLNDEVSDLNLSEVKAELLAFILLSWNLFDHSTKISHFPNCERNLSEFDSMGDNLT